MIDDDLRVLLVPGLGGSGSEHWQTIWSGRRSGCSTVEQQDWHAPDPAGWAATLDAAIGERAAVLVAHSLGCATVAHWAANYPTSRVVAALLVAPCDVERVDVCAGIARFAPMPRTALPFRTTLVASRDDPYASIDRARCFAEHWGSALVDAGHIGHINADSGLGDWRFGQVLLDDLLATVSDGRHARVAALRAAARPSNPCAGA